MLNNHFYIACITFHYLPRFATKMYTKSHSTPRPPAVLDMPTACAEAFGLCFFPIPY